MSVKIILAVIIVFLIAGGGIFFLTSKKETASLVTQPGNAEQPSPTAAPSTFTMADVAKRNTKESCWAVVNGKVYDLTSWIDSHPGGPERILSLCGSDGTMAFNQQHGNDSLPPVKINQFYIGDLVQ